ncbi:MAG: DUF99 family protein [Candidatus Bathyarchaeota archaeon]|nr:DUF99 family protein [Candidatus Bathyarchaeota archaeon]
MVPKRFHSIKPEIRVLGIDDGGFVPRTKGTVDVVGVVYRGGYWFEGVMRAEITIDGLDATEKIAAMIESSPYYRELRIVVLDGVTFAGFNVVDISKLSRRVDLPVISVARKKPDLEEIRSALKNLPDFEIRWRAMENAGKIFEVETRKGENPVYMHIAGILREDAEKIMKKTSTRSLIPEALRVAHIIASGLTRSREKI